MLPTTVMTEGGHISLQSSPTPQTHATLNTTSAAVGTSTPTSRSEPSSEDIHDSAPSNEEDEYEDVTDGDEKDTSIGMPRKKKRRLTEEQIHQLALARDLNGVTGKKIHTSHRLMVAAEIGLPESAVRNWLNNHKRKRGASSAMLSNRNNPPISTTAPFPSFNPLNPMGIMPSPPTVMDPAAWMNVPPLPLQQTPPQPPTNLTNFFLSQPNQFIPPAIHQQNYAHQMQQQQNYQQFMQQQQHNHLMGFGQQQNGWNNLNEFGQFNQSFPSGSPSSSSSGSNATTNILSSPSSSTPASAGYHNSFQNGSSSMMNQHLTSYDTDSEQVGSIIPMLQARLQAQAAAAQQMDGTGEDNILAKIQAITHYNRVAVANDLGVEPSTFDIPTGAAAQQQPHQPMSTLSQFTNGVLSFPPHTTTHSTIREAIFSDVPDLLRARVEMGAPDIGAAGGVEANATPSNGHHVKEPLDACVTGSPSVAAAADPSGVPNEHFDTLRAQIRSLQKKLTQAFEQHVQRAKEEARERENEQEQQRHAMDNNTNGIASSPTIPPLLSALPLHSPHFPTKPLSASSAFPPLEPNQAPSPTPGQNLSQNGSGSNSSFINSTSRRDSEGSGFHSFAASPAVMPHPSPPLEGTDGAHGELLFDKHLLDAYYAEDMRTQIGMSEAFLGQ